MKYCLKYTNICGKLNKADEISIKYIEDKGLIDFMKKFSSQRIILRIDPANFSHSEVKKLIAIHKQYPQYNFAVTLLKLIDLKGISDVECYKKANVSKQTWYKIMNERDYRPSKNTVLCFAIALKLTLEETEKLLATVGFTLSKSSKFDIIIEYFILNEEYNVFIINETLFKFDQVCLGG